MSEPILKKNVKKKLSSKIVTKTVVKPVTAKAIEKSASKKVTVTKKQTPSRLTKILIKNKAFSKRISKNPLLQKDKVKLNSEDSEVVILPQKVNQNLLNRVEFYKKLVNRNSLKYMRRVTFVSGYTFIIFGFALTILSFNLKNSDFKHQLATTLCIDTACTASDLSTTTTVSIIDTTSTTSEPIIKTVSDALKLVEPTVFFSTDVEAEPKSNFELSVKATDISDLKLFLVTSTDKKIEIPVSHHDLNYYFFMMPVDTLLPESYTIRAIAFDSSKTTKYYFTGPSFTIINKTLTETPSVSSLESTSTVGTTEIASENVDPLATSSVTIEKSLDANKFLVKIEPTSDNYLFKVLIKSPGTNAVEVYAQSKFSTVPLFLGLAKKSDVGWVYFLDSRNLPLGNYAIFAKTVYNTDTISTTFVPFSTTPEMYKTPIYSTNDSDAVNTTTDSVIFAEKVKHDLLQTDNTTSSDENKLILEQRNSYFTTLDKFKTIDTDEPKVSATSGSSTISQLEIDIKNEVDKILKGSERDLNLLYKKYASAIQSGDENLIRIAKEEINKYRDSLITKITIDTRTKDIASHIINELNLEFERLDKQVNRYEVILRDRSNQINKDTDGDGLTDFDEVTLYNTNSSNPDTDNDGVLDGVEIMTNFDPLNANQNTVVSFHSPKDVNYIDDKNLVIESVTPIIETDINKDKLPLLAEIKGKGLPNSFVTLFIYSSPTVVTVKTDAEGNFSYTFTKELEDGNHEVYVAITDNKGAIVARSNPFEFIKTAEAFSPIDIEETNSSVISSECVNCSDESIISPYNITAAMGVVSFGLILLMLGRTLRNRPEETEVKHDSTI